MNTKVLGIHVFFKTVGIPWKIPTFPAAIITIKGSSNLEVEMSD